MADPIDEWPRLLPWFIAVFWFAVALYAGSVFIGAGAAVYALVIIVSQLAEMMGKGD